MLRDVARLESGHTPSRREPSYWDGGEIPWLSLKDISGLVGRYVSETHDTPTQAGIDNSSARILPKGTVAFCRTASVGKVAILGRDMATSQDFANWVCGPDLLPEYLYEAIRASGEQFVKEKQGSTHKTIYMPVLERFKVLVPPLSEQHRIADILDKADAVRRKRKQAIALTEELLRSAFLEIFGDPVTNPKGWPVRPFADLVAETQLGLVRAAAEQSEARAYPYVRMNAIRSDGHLDLSNLTRVDATLAEVANSHLQDGDFLFNTRNSRELVGKAAVYHGNGTHLFNNNILRVRFRSGVESDFVSGYWQTSAAQQQLDARKAGTTSVFAIYYRNLATLPVPVPPASLQANYAALCAVARKSLHGHGEHAMEARRFFESLVSRAFAGQLSGTEAAC